MRNPATDLLLSERGQAAVETFVVASVLIALVAGALVIMYLSFARVWIDRCAYEAVICLASESQVFDCERRFRSSVAGALPIGELEQARLTRVLSQAKVEVQFTVTGLPPLSRTELIKLPLHSGARLETRGVQ